MKTITTWKLVDGKRTTDVAWTLGVSNGRVRRARRELHEGWEEFHGDDAEHR